MAKEDFVSLFTKQQNSRLVQIQSTCRQQNVTQNLKFVFRKVENVLGKGEIADCQHFLLFPKCFQKPPFSGSLKVGIVWERVKLENLFLSPVSFPPTFYPSLSLEPNYLSSHNNPCFQCNIAITNFLVSNTCEIRFHDIR